MINTSTFFSLLYFGNVSYTFKVVIGIYDYHFWENEVLSKKLEQNKTPINR
jgi:hypothetical protein